MLLLGQVLIDPARSLLGRGQNTHFSLGLEFIQFVPEGFLTAEGLGAVAGKGIS